MSRPLTQFDAAAVPMLNAFTDQPNLRPFDVITPQQSLDETNAATAPLAAASDAQDISQEDRIDEQTFNQAIWQSVKGPTSTMPAPVHRPQSTTPTNLDTEEAPPG